MRHTRRKPNVVMAKNAGLSAAEIDAVATDGPVSGINPECCSMNISIKIKECAARLSKRGNTMAYPTAYSSNCRDPIAPRNKLFSRYGQILSAGKDPP